MTQITFDMGSLQNSYFNRIEVIDALRGFALLGVLLANVPSFTGEESHFAMDKELLFLYHLLISNKFISIFSILFGLGFYIQWQGAQEKQQAFVRYFVIRMALLFLIGSIHGWLVWNGDILRAYAIGGLGLLIIRNWPRKRLLTTAIIFIIGLTALAFIVNGMIGWAYSYEPALLGEHYRTSSIIRYLQINIVTDPWTNFWIDLPITLVYTFGCMLVGFILGDIGYFTQPQKWRVLSSRFMLIGGTLGLGASWVYQQVVSGALELGPELIWLPFLISGGMFMQSLMYIALFVSLFKQQSFRRILSGFKPVGRTSLSSYLFQSVFFLLVFIHCLPPLRLFDTQPVWGTWLIALLFFVFQSLGSWLWLKKFQQGPIEYLWKSSSYSFLRKRKSSNNTNPIIDIKRSLPND